MQAVILAGGLGTRLKPLTKTVPKVMVQINNRPFIAYLLELLSNNGIKNVVMCTGYLGEQIKEYLGDGRRFEVKIVYSEEKENLLGTGGAIKQAQGFLDERFFIINGDTYLPIDYRDVEASFTEREQGALMVVGDGEENSWIQSNVEIDTNSMVVKYDKEKFEPSFKYVDAGVLALRREELNTIEDGHPISLEKGLYPRLIKERKLTAYIARVTFYDIGTPEQLKPFEQYLKGLPI